MKRYVTGIGASLAFLGLGGLLAGFAPSPIPTEWRGRLNLNTTDVRMPLADPSVDTLRHSTSVSGRVDLKASHPVSSVPSASGGTNAKNASLLRFEGQSVSLLTENGPHAFASGQSTLSPLLSLLSAGSARGAGDGALLASALEEAALAGDGEALGSDGRPLRWTPRLMGPELCVVMPSLPKFGLQAHPPLRVRISRYQDIVEAYAKKYHLDTALVLAIMKTESGFDPSLISSRDAHGLMQVVPETAGDEVRRWFRHDDTPTGAELLNPDNNIRYGMTYLHLLRTKHFEGVENPQSLEYCVVAAYNGGSGAVLRHFGATREEAMAAINALSPDEVLTRLTEALPLRETRAFVRKVFDTRSQFMAVAG